MYFHHICRNCFTQSNLQDTLNEFSVDSCTIVDVTTFEIILLMRASCILGQADDHIEAAELLWKIQELVTALALRNDYIQQANEIRKR